jgi:hypothetical protein
MRSAVLLPLRLETRFDGTRLRLRVIPDEPWFDRHEPVATPAELADLERYLAIARAGHETPKAVAAWRTFAEQHGPARAAWLVRQSASAAPRLADDDETLFTRIIDFPSELQVWLARGGAAPTLAATLPIDHARLRMEPPDPNVPLDRRWWESWTEAVEAGLGTTIELGKRADDIDAVYVVGLGDTSPAALFASHRDAGQLGILAPGSPTNAVDDGPEPDLGGNPDVWLALLHRGPRNLEQQLSFALTGDRDLIGPVPGDTTEHHRTARWLLTGLWPALIGHTFTDVLGLGPQVAQAQNWAAENLDPLGVHPTVRIGAQPYGLLPATSLADWVPGPTDSRVEEAIRAALLTLRQLWIRAAIQAGRGAADGADAERLIELLSQPAASRGYATRFVYPIEFWLFGLMATGFQIDWARLLREWNTTYPLMRQLGLRPCRRYGSRGFTRRIRRPLVTPAGLPAGTTVGTVLGALLDLARAAPTTFAETAAVQSALGLPTASVFLQLVIRSLQVAIGDIGREKLGVRLGTLDPIAVLFGPEIPEKPQVLSTWIQAVGPADLDAETVTARAYRQIEDVLRRSSGGVAKDIERLLPAAIDCATYRIDPWLTGIARSRLRRLQDEPPLLGAYGWVDRPTPGPHGPTAGRLLHAPSLSQALTAALIRDRAINDPEPERWHMDVSSTTARRAERLAEEVRRGAHPAEALGREVERAIGDPVAIARIRALFPLRGPNGTRRTCHGQRVLAAPPTSLGLSAEVLAELGELRAAIDVYSDLLLADAVHRVVEGRAGSAGTALDAAAGLGRPPELDMLRTRRESRPAETSSLVVLPDIAPPPLPSDPADLAAVSPSAIADPAVAAFVRERVGRAQQWRWDVTGAGGGQATVTLADLGLQPADALALALGALEQAVLAAVPFEGAQLAARDGSARYARAVRLVGLIGRVPAGPEDAVEIGEADSAGTTATVLRRRLADLRAVAQALLGRLATGEPGALRLARQWGLAPEPELENPAAEAHRRLSERLAAAPDASAADALDPLQLAAAVAALVSPTGQLAVCGQLRRVDLPTLAPAPALERQWLAYIAPVRAAMARLEAFQLAAGTPAGIGSRLTSWTNRPQDPWQENITDLRRLITAHAPADLDLAAGGPADRTFAVGRLDRFAEAIPGAEQTTTGAFGFDAPGARAPQAILLAVPPDLSKPLDAATLVAIVADTRSLARARMAMPSDLDEISGAAPLPLLPTNGATAIQF